MRHRITVQSLSTVNQYGGPVETWSDVGTVWAEITPVRASERFIPAADQEQAAATHVVRMRYLAGLSPVNHRIVWGSKTLDIETVEDPTGRSAEMRVTCREIVATGSITVL